MVQTLYDGIPLERDYRALVESDAFRALEKSSDSFVSANRRILKDYVKNWVEDPLHQWSRQWEYPFVCSRVQQLIQREPRPKILDAGSGITFLPYYLSSQFNEARLYCCDYDKTLASTFEQLNAGIDKSVEFSTADLRDLPYEKELFHMVYCISVLEHTDDYETIIEEFYRILRPDGALVVTFDISLDGTQDIDVDKAATLLSSLANRFQKDRNLSLNLRSHVSTPGIFTTLTAKDINVDLLPWKAPSFLYRIKSFVATRRFGSWPPLLTVFCLSLTKGSI